MKQALTNLQAEFLRGLAHGNKRPTEDHNVIGNVRRIVDRPTGERHAVIGTQQIAVLINPHLLQQASRRLVFDNYGNLVQPLGELSRKLGDGLLKEKIKLGPFDSQKISDVHSHCNWTSLRLLPPEGPWRLGILDLRKLGPKRRFDRGVGRKN